MVSARIEYDRSIAAPPFAYTYVPARPTKHAQKRVTKTKTKAKEGERDLEVGGDYLAGGGGPHLVLEVVGRTRTSRLRVSAAVQRVLHRPVHTHTHTHTQV
jgi:hypothetical protein